MPRLTNTDFLEEHYNLAYAEQAEPLIFGSVTVPEQWALHAYFVPTKDLSNNELLAHRRVISIEQPSLPQRAGRALAHVKRNFDMAYQRANGDRKVFRQTLSHLSPGDAVVIKRGRQVRAVAIGRPEPDYKLMAKVLLDVVRDVVRERRR